MAASIPFLLFFGGLGLFTFGWSGAMIVAQLGHILMVSAIIYTVLVISYKKLWKKCIAGLILGIIAFAVFLPIQNGYVKGHPELIKKLGDTKFKKLMLERRE
jgi:uncharacterized membrane protein YagU involved in acid resistance